jgi:hypothetical protein
MLGVDASSFFGRLREWPVDAADAAAGTIWSINASCPGKGVI